MPIPRESSGRWGTSPNPVKPRPKYSFTWRVSELFNPNCTKVEIEAFCGPSLGAMKRFRAGQAVITLHTAGLAVGVLPVDLQELHGKRSAFPVQKFFGVEI